MIDNTAFYKLSYGLFVLSAKDGDKDNACIVNTVIQISDNPKTIAVAVNKTNYTHDMIKKTGVFNASVIDESAPFSVFEKYGFSSGRNTDKFTPTDLENRTSNGLVYVKDNVCAVFSAKVIAEQDCSTHTLFIAQVEECEVIADTAPMTYAYYFANVKPKPQAKKKGWVCKICGYVYEGEELPPDFVCPLCKHGAEDFEPLK